MGEPQGFNCIGQASRLCHPTPTSPQPGWPVRAQLSPVHLQTGHEAQNSKVTNEGKGLLEVGAEAEEHRWGERPRSGILQSLPLHWLPSLIPHLGSPVLGGGTVLFRVAEWELPWKPGLLVLEARSQGQHLG